MMQNNERTITKIEANPLLDIRKCEDRPLRVAAYCRVSTDSEDQINSYNAQKKYYTDFIKSNPKWRFVDVYADEGLSGTRVKKRENFMRMIRDCEKGKIDLILIKSVSRYSRNTLDSISYLRRLKRLGIAIYFDEQNLDTQKEESEITMALHSAMAQAESENISANVKWGINKRMQNGTYRCNMNMYGYRRDKDTKAIIVIPEEAEIVKKVFSMFLDGNSTHQIKKYLEKNKIKTFAGKDTWSHSTINKMLQNEKYVGDIIYQKTYCEDCISKIIKVNNGQKDKYYVKNNHPAIIDRDTFQRAQAEMVKRTARNIASESSITGIGRYSSTYVLSQLLVCDDCGGIYRRKYKKKKDGVFHYWRCNSRLESGDKYCDNSKGLEEKQLQRAICGALSKVIAQQEEGYAVMRSHLLYAVTGDKSTEELYAIEKSIRDEENHMNELIDLAVSSEGNSDKYELAIKDSNNKISVLKEERNKLMELIQDNKKAKLELERLQTFLSENRAVVDEFDEATIYRAIECIRVTKDMKLIISIKGNIKVTEDYSLYTETSKTA